MLDVLRIFHDVLRMFSAQDVLMISYGYPGMAGLIGLVAGLIGLAGRVGLIGPLCLEGLKSCLSLYPTPTHR